MSTVLVTGGAGFIGSHLCRALLREGREVIAYDNLDDFYDVRIKRANLASLQEHARFRFIEGDIRDRAALDALFRAHAIESVVHLAARAGVRPSIEQPVLYADVNVTGTATLLEAMHDADVRHMLFASSSSVYGNQEKVPFSEDDPVDHPISPYAATKKAGELLCHSYVHTCGMNIWCLRFFTVYGPGQRPEMAIARFLRAAHVDEVVTVYGDGSMMRDFTYVDDIVRGVVAALPRVQGYEIANIGGAHAHALHEVLDIVEQVSGRTLERRHVPVPEGDVRMTSADTSRAARLFGFHPSVPLAEGIRRQWQSMQQQTVVVEAATTTSFSS